MAATDFELAAHHPRTVFSHRVSHYGVGNCRLHNQHHHAASLSLSKVHTSRRYASPIRQSSSHAERKPGRPCLVIRPEDANSSCSSSSSGDETESTSPIRQKKKVVFADDRGFSLTQVRMMVELPYSIPFSLNLPPHQIDNVSPKRANNPSTDCITTTIPIPTSTTTITNSTSSKTNNNNNNNNNSNAASGSNNNNCCTSQDWKSTFSQPASNYLDFRKKLDEENVSLENVIIKEGCKGKEIAGTIKVKNICYEKDVFVRTTMDDWSTHNDVLCSFVGNNHQPSNSVSVVILYDTFSFSLVLPSASEGTLQFCVCFRNIHGEFWDNNKGTNYSIVKDAPQENLTSNAQSSPVRKSLNSHFRSGIKSKTWPEFNSDQHTVPYW